MNTHKNVVTRTRYSCNDYFVRSHTHTRTQTHVQVVWRALLDYFCREKGFPDDLLSIEIDLKWVQKGTLFPVFFLKAFFPLQVFINWIIVLMANTAQCILVKISLFLQERGWEWKIFRVSFWTDITKKLELQQFCRHIDPIPFTFQH